MNANTIRQNPPLKNLKNLKIMEVCGTHTSSIVRSGLREFLPAGIRMVSGPGCPVCVTSADYIDGVIYAAKEQNAVVASFGDLFRVRGSLGSFASKRAEGQEFIPVYSPFDAVNLARANPQKSYIFAAVGFETTIPLYALILETIINKNIKNLKLALSLKTMPEVLDWLCQTQQIDGFICPGHVSVIIGKSAYISLFEKYHKPFVISGFTPEEILTAVKEIYAQHQTGLYSVKNLYPSVVKDEGNIKAKNLIETYFTKTDGLWRGIGMIQDSALVARPEYADYVVNIKEKEDNLPDGCQCDEILTGRAMPDECPLFGKFCRPEEPVGACMVSAEGSCRIYYENR